MSGKARRTVGVEEEFLLVDPASGHARARSSAVLRSSEDSAVTGSAELHREQIEVETSPCTSLAELAAQVGRQRGAVMETAHRVGVEVAALASSPLPVHPSLTRDDRYQRMGERFGLTAREALTCGCHVHVEVDSADEGVAVINRIRPWLPALLAISANSPFWQGEDTGYQSYRSQAWLRWPSAGPTGSFDSAREYQDVVDQLMASGVPLDRKMVYFDARLSETYPTVEVRVADVCLRGDDTVLVAGLTRALVETAVRDWRAGGAHRPYRIEVARLAMWQAGHTGLAGDLVSPVSGRPLPVRKVLAELVEQVEPALATAGELELVVAQLERTLRQGGGATTQRRTAEGADSLEAVVRAATETITEDLQLWSA